MKIRLINTTTRLPADKALESVLKRMIHQDMSKAIDDLIHRLHFRETYDQAIDIYLVSPLDDIQSKTGFEPVENGGERRREYSEGSSEDMPDTEVLGRYFSHHLVFHKPVIEVCPEKIMQAARRLNEKMAKKLPIVDIYPALFCMVVIHEIGHALMDEDKSPADHKKPWSWIAHLFDDGDTERFDSYLDDFTKPIGKCHECHRWPRAVPVELERMEHIIEESLANAIAVKQKYNRSQKRIIREFISRQSKPYRAGLKWQMDLTDLLKTAEAWGQFKHELLRGPATYDYSKDCSVTKCLVHRLIDDNLPPETTPLSTNSFKAEFAKHLAEKI